MPAERIVIEERDHEAAQDKGVGLTLRRVLVLRSVLACALLAVVFGGEEAHACRYADRNPPILPEGPEEAWTGI